MGVDFANVKVFCANCQQEVDPEVLIDSYDVDYFAELIPDEYKENFLKKLGFEKKQGNLIPKGILRFLVILSVTLIAIGAIIFATTQSKIFDAFWILSGAGSVIVTFILYYKEATKLKWRKIKKNR
jgi:hypothetical protein